MKEYKCPKCGSENVLVKMHVDKCEDCGWTKISETPCSTCGNPSVGVFGMSGVTTYYCKEHSEYCKSQGYYGHMEKSE